MDLLDQLNDAQARAVQSVDGPLLILAGPGSGKTRVITHRIAYLLRDRGVDPYHILAVTFTNKAAREMMARVDALAPGAVGRLTMGTFHAVCSRILRREGGRIGIEPDFVIYDDEDQLGTAKVALRGLNLDEKQFSPRAILSTISNAKSEVIDPLTYAERANTYWEEVVARVYRAYQDGLRSNGALDFDDLIMSTVRLFRTQADVLDRYQERYRYILVDEFQDTNIAQYELIKLLGRKYRNVCVVGDEDQSIYGWRAADIRNILNFEHDFPGAAVVYLEQNYRSTKTILGAAQRVIAANALRKEKQLWTDNPEGTRITLFEAYNEQEEARYVVSELERLVARGEATRGECAVMYRTNAQSRAIEEACLRRGVPYRLVGGTRFYARREVKDVLAYLRLAQNPDDTASFWRILNVPPRGLGQKTVTELERWAKRLGVSPARAIELLAGYGPETLASPPPFAGRAERALVDFAELLRELRQKSTELDVASFLDYVVKRTGYADLLQDGTEAGEERWQNVKELGTVAGDWASLRPEAGLASFLEEVALASDVDELDERGDAVTLITLHAAKGLEFRVVFLVGLEEGVCPHSRSFDDPTRMEEERRLFYVGMTRAMERLYLVYAFRRTLFGNQQVNVPSRFLADIPKSLLAEDGATARTPAPSARERTARAGHAAQATLWSAPATGGSAVEAPPATARFKIGDRVRHAKFGEGIVVETELTRDDQEVKVAFAGIGVKRLSVNLARLEKL